MRLGRDLIEDAAVVFDVEMLTFFSTLINQKRFTTVLPELKIENSLYAKEK